MTFKGRVAISVMLALTAYAPVLHAKSVTVTGEIATKRPILNVNTSKLTFEAFVEPIRVELKGAVDSGCVLTPIVDQAIGADNIEELVCLYDFETPYRLDRSVDSNRNTILEGTFDKIGTTEIPITATFFSGSAETPINIPINDVLIEAVEPQPINVTSIKWSTLMSSEGDGDTYEINSPFDAQKVLVSLNTEVKDYDRVITFDDFGECIIRAGKDSGCNIYLNKQSFGSEDDRLGEKKITIRADAKNRYFSENNLAPEKVVTVKWDSRLPEHVKLLRGGVDGEDTHTLPNGTVIKAEQGEWIQLFTTPHYERNDDWWKVESSIEMKPNLTNHITPPKIEVRGADYSYLWESRRLPTETRLVSRDIQYFGEYIVVKYNTSVLQGAEYSYHSKTTDKYLNTKEVDGQSIVEQLPIEFIKFVGGELHQDHEEKAKAAYFPKDVKFAMFSRFRDLNIKSTKINGKDIAVEQVNGQNHFYQLAGFPENMIAGEELRLDVVITDSRGYDHEFAIPFIAQPFKVKLKNEKAFKDVQKYKLEMFQESSSGIRECQFFATEEAAKRTQFQSVDTIHCYLVWENLDDSMSYEAKSYKYTLKGVPANANPTYNYRVHFVDSSLETAISDLKSVSLIAEDVPDVVLKIENADTIVESDGTMAFAVPIEGGPVATIRAKLINADSFLLGTNPFGDDVLVDINQMGSTLSDASRAFFRVNVEPGVLWKQGFFTVTTGYKHNEAYTKSQNVKMVYVPNERVAAFLTTENKMAVNTGKHIVTAGVGEYKRSDRSYTYDQSIHGDWSVELKKYLPESREWVTIDTAENLKSDGTVDFEIDLNGYEGDESFRFKTVMSIHSDYADYSREIESRSLSLLVNEGGEVKAKIDTSRWTGKAPFRMRPELDFESLSYRKAFGSAAWYFKEFNDSDWTLIPDQNKSSVGYTFTEDGRYNIKAVVVNKFTGTTTEIISPDILTYSVPTFKLNYNKSEYLGQNIEVSVTTDKDTSLYDYQWATGKCTDWNDGDATFTYPTDSEGRVYVCARLAYKNTELADKYRWKQMRSSVNVESADPLRINIYTNRSSEVGFETELVATISTPSDIRHNVKAQWFTPSGTAIPSQIEVLSNDRVRLTAKHVVTEDDLLANTSEDETKPFVVKAEIDGISGTATEAKSKMKVLIYRFPEFEINARQEFTYFPTEATVNATMVTRPEVSAEYTYDWLVRDGNELISSRDTSRGSLAVYDVNREGLISYALIIKDDRGNERLYETFSTTEKPKDAEIKINASFSTRKMRYPVDASFRAQVDYEHRRDKISEFEWFVNGEFVSDSSDSVSPRMFYTAEETGDYEVKFIAKSVFGATDEQTYSFSVVDNAKPTCKLRSRQESTSFVFKPDCKDSDGKLLRTLIEIPEIHGQSTSKSYRVTHSKLVGINSLTVNITAWDDSNESTTISENIAVPETVSDPSKKDIEVN